jgi:hypothetical protein
MNICVIGNSQGAALVQGLALLTDRNRISHKVDFFCVVGGGGPRLEFSGKTIIVPEEGVDSSITLEGGYLSLDGYQAILLSGVGIYALRKNNPHPLNTHFFLEANSSDHAFSMQFMERLLRAWVREIPSVQNIRRLRQIFDGRILVQPFPMPVEAILDQADFELPYDREAIRSIFKWHAAIHDDELARTASEVDGCDLVSYPTDWLESGFTPGHFASVGDAWHMNANFGAFYMAKVFAVIDAM